MEAPGPGYRHYGKNHLEQFFQQLTVERAATEFKAGKEIRRFQNPDKRRNEGLDCSVYELAAFRLRKWNFDAIEADLIGKPAVPEEEKPKVDPRKPVSRVAGGFVGVSAWQV
jgi:phage terminase large subunit GpA-like protein